METGPKGKNSKIGYIYIIYVERKLNCDVLFITEYWYSQGYVVLLWTKQRVGIKNFLKFYSYMAVACDSYKLYSLTSLGTDVQCWSVKKTGRNIKFSEKIRQNNSMLSWTDLCGTVCFACSSIDRVIIWKRLLSPVCQNQSDAFTKQLLISPIDQNSCSAINSSKSLAWTEKVDLKREELKS